MTSGIDVTLQVLATTKNEAALPWLSRTLQSEPTAFRFHGLQALLERRCTAGFLAVIQQWHRLSEAERQVVAQQGKWLSAGISGALFSTDSQWSDNACQAAVQLRDYDQIPNLVRVAEVPNNPVSEHAAQAVAALANDLYGELTAPRDYRVRRDPALVRLYVYPPLEESVRRFASHRQTALVEAFLLLVSKDNSLLRYVVSEPDAAAYTSVISQLTKSPRPGVMRLILELLEERNPPEAVLHVLSRRQDTAFVHFLLTQPPDPWTPNFKQNLRKVTSWPWLSSDLKLLAVLTDQELSAAVRWVAESGVRLPRLLEVVRFVIRRGGALSRHEATLALTQLHGTEANDLILTVLEDVDPQVQSQAVRNLCARGIPGAVSRLIRLLDSPHALVRLAVQGELAAFTFPRYLRSFEALNPEAREVAGPIIKRVDPNAVRLLRAELTSLARSRRLRGLELAVAMQAAPEVEGEILRISCDEDHFVRAASVPALFQANSAQSQSRLDEMRSDPAALVRETAEGAVGTVVPYREFSQ